MLDSASFMVRPWRNDEVILLNHPARDFKKSPPFRKYAMKLCIIHCYHLVHRNFAWHLLWRSTTEGLFTWRWGTPGRWRNPLRWGNPPVHIICHFNLITFTSEYMIGGLTRQMLPHLPEVPHLHVNRPWEQKYCQSFDNKPNHSHPVLRGRIFSKGKT